MKKFIACLVFLLVSCHSENDFKSKVIALSGTVGFCSGVQVSLPSGKTAILTAAHCQPLIENGFINAQAEGSSRAIPRKVLEISPETDLMLLEGVPELPGVEVGTQVSIGSYLEAYTHGSKFKTYKSVGYLIDLRTILFLAMDKPLFTEDDERACLSKPKNHIVDMMGLFQICVTSLEEYATTMDHIVPGSSGGPVFSDGKLVGIVSAGDENHFAYLVKLEDIKKFLAPY